ncbi:MAG: ArnT family glycosyltransferase [Bacteroidia bacterium]
MAKTKQEEKKGGKGAISSGPLTLFDRMDKGLEKRHKTLFYCFASLCALISLILFNARPSDGGDDSTYIQAGWEYSRHFFHYYYSFNAPFYPIFLSLPIKLFGIHLIFLKLLSVPMQFFGLIFFYKAFHKRMPYVVLFPVLFFIAVNGTLQYYASQTNNEAFYMFWQGLFFLVFVKLLDVIESEQNSLRETWKLWLWFGVLAFILTLTKNIAICMVPAIPLFFLLQKKWKEAGFSLVSFLGVKVIFELVKSLLWRDVAKGQLNAQGNILLLKDPYDASKGTDDFMGFVGRFFDNINIYLSKRFFQIIGFRDPASTELYFGLALLVVILLLGGLVAIYRSKNKLLLFAALYTLSIIAGVFFVLQTRWDQPRMIILQMHLMLLIIFYALYTISKKREVLQILYLVTVFILCSSMITSTLNQSGKTLPVLAKNLRGDKYYGFTPDWVNFLKMSRWCADSLPESSLVASRKAPMSFLYAHGKKFFPVYKVPFYDTLTHQSNPDSVMAYFKREHVTHVIIASLRMDPARNTGDVINTLHHMLGPVQESPKYKDKIVFVRREGESEPADLYEIRY